MGNILIKCALCVLFICSLSIPNSGLASQQDIKQAESIQSKSYESEEKEHFQIIREGGGADAWVNLAKFYSETKQYEKTVKVCKKIKDDFPEYSALVTDIKVAALEAMHQEREKKLEKKTESTAGDSCRTVDGELFGTTEDNYKMAVDIMLSGDKEAFLKMALSGRAGFLPGGKKVSIDDVGMFSERAKVRVEGTTGYIWTGTSGFSCP